LFSSKVYLQGKIKEACWKLLFQKVLWKACESAGKFRSREIWKNTEDKKTGQFVLLY